MEQQGVGTAPSPPCPCCPRPAGSSVAGAVLAVRVGSQQTQRGRGCCCCCWKGAWKGREGEDLVRSSLPRAVPSVGTPAWRDPGWSLIPGWALSSGRINQGDKKLLQPLAELPPPPCRKHRGLGPPLSLHSPLAHSRPWKGERGASSGLPPPQGTAARSRRLGQHRDKGTPPRAAVPSQGCPEG